MLSAEDLRRVMAEKEAKKASEAMSKLRAAEEEKRHRHEMFMAGKLTPERMQRMMSRIHSQPARGSLFRASKRTSR